MAVIGTLLGGLLGATTSYFIQAAGYRREAGERLQTLRRQVYVDWLSRSHDFYTALRLVSAKHREGRTTPDEFIDELRRIPPQPVQIALEHLRLTAGEDVAASAAHMWTHMRRERVPLGADRSNEGWRLWNRNYWLLRRAFLDAARAELMLDAFDWDVVGADSRLPPRAETDRGGQESPAS